MSPHASSVCVSKLTIGEDERSHFVVSAMSKPKWETLHKYLKFYPKMVLRMKIGRESDLYFRSHFSKCKTQILEKTSWRRHPYYTTSGHKERWN